MHRLKLIFESHCKLIKYRHTGMEAGPIYNPNASVFDELGMRLKELKSCYK